MKPPSDAQVLALGQALGDLLAAAMQRATQQDRLLTIEQVAERWGMTQQYVRDVIETGGLAVVEMPNGRPAPGRPAALRLRTLRVRLSVVEELERTLERTRGKKLKAAG